MLREPPRDTAIQAAPADGRLLRSGVPHSRTAQHRCALRVHCRTSPSSALGSHPRTRQAEGERRTAKHFQEEQGLRAAKALGKQGGESRGRIEVQAGGRDLLGRRLRGPRSRRAPHSPSVLSLHHLINPPRPTDRL